MFPVEKLDDVEHIANKDSDKYGFKAIKSQQELFNPFVPRIVAVSSKLGLISFVTGKYVVGYEIGIFFTDLNKSFFKSEILNVQSLQFIESVDFPQLAISLPNKIQIHPLYTDSSSAGLIETIEIPENTKQIIFISHFLVYLESNQTLTFIDLKNKNSKSVFSIPDVLSIQKLQNSLTYFKNNKIYQINSDTLENIASGDSKMLIKYPFDIPNCFEYRFTYKENCVCFSNDPTDPKKLILTFIDSEKGVILYRSIPNFYIDDFNTNKVLITSSIHYPFVTLICEKRREIISLYTKDSSQFKILNPNDNKTFISPRSPKLDYKQIDATFMTSFDYLIPSVNNNYCLLIFYGDDFVFLYQYIDTENYFSNNEMSPIEATHFLYDEEKSSSEEDEEDYGNNEEEETKNGEEEETNNEEEEETKNEDEEETKNDEEEETKNTSKEEEEEKKEIIANLESDSDNVNFIGINVKKAPNQNKSETQKRAEIQQFPPYDNQDKIKFKFNSTLKFKSKLQFKPYLFKVSSYFGLLITYNEENETLETYNLEHNLYYEEEDLLEPESENPETLPNSTLLIWTHSISKDSLKSITVVENQQYPLVVIGTDEGFIFLQIKNGAKYLDIKVNCGGVSQIQYKNSRPNEIVCLSSNSTLFSYNFVTDENDIICSKVSCFTIVKNGNIVFISGHNIFKCSKSSNVEQIQTIFEDNRFIVPVMNEYVFILSKEMIDSTEYPIFSLLNHETNTIVSCYKKDITDSFEPSNTCISSSEFHPLVVVGSEDTFGLYYFNATSIERFEQLVLDDANCILAQFNEETFEDEKYSGFEFFESSFYSFLLFPSLIHLFDDRIIRFYSIETINVDEFPYSLLTPTFQPISFDDIDLIKDNKLDISQAPSVSLSASSKPIEEIQQFPPYDNQDKIKFKFNSTLKFKSKLQFKPYLFKVSSYFGLLITYNEENETLETYNLEHNLYYEEEDLLEPQATMEDINNSSKPLLIWKYSIPKESIKSITVVEDIQHPLIIVGSKEGLTFLQIKNGSKFSERKVNCGGVSQIIWNRSRPKEVVCLGSNSTLFTYNFMNQESDIICSKVSCFTIVKNGNIVFISGHNIFKCSKSSNVEQIQTIFEDNRFIVPVMNEYVFILSKEMIDSTEYPIFSLLNHETNTIVSCYKKDITDSFEPSNTCISSSEFHPLVVVGSEDTFGLYYFNATSIERFEQLVLDDANCILAQFNEETFEDEKYSGFEFFESSFYSFLLFPSLIHLFDDRIIRFYSIETINVDEFPYSLLTPTFQPISFDDIKEDIKEEKVGNINFNKPSISMLTRKSKLFSNCGTFIKNPVSLFSNQFTPTPRTTLKSNVYINPFKHPLDNPSYVKKQQSQKPSIFHSRFGK